MFLLPDENLEGFTEHMTMSPDKIFIVSSAEGSGSLRAGFIA
jgi:hypothetical protein